MKKIIVIIVIIFQPFMCVGQDYFNYSLDQYGNASIRLDEKQKKKASGELVIPEYVGKKNEFRVLNINDFRGCANITSVVIPKQAYTIDYRAFRGCYNLKSVIIPESVREIKSEAFARCTNLQFVIIPNKTTSIGDNAFAGCINLIRVKIPDELRDNRGYSSLEKPIFEGCKNLSEIEGYSIKYPEWIDKELDPSSPIYKKLTNMRSSFSYFAQEKLLSYIQNWQKRKPIETLEQWKERVTESNRKKKIEEYLSTLQSEYIAKMDKGIRYNGSNCLLMEYDTDYNIYRIIFPSTREGYIKVPQQDAAVFKEKYKKYPHSVYIIPTYGIVNDHFEMLSFYVELDGKKYESVKTYENDNIEELAISLPPIDVNLKNNQEDRNTKNRVIDNRIDLNIPTTSIRKNNTFAVIIGNERYLRVAHVPYANNDAKIFAEYCKKTLGLPMKNVKVYENATYGTMIGAVSDIQKIAKAFKGDLNVIFYYAGHGIPDEVTGEGYLLPIDADGLKTEVCYPLNRLFRELGGLGAKSVVAFLDACFSGAHRGDGMVVAARGVAIKAKNGHPIGNTIVFSAATDKQTAFPYEEMEHGMFTYYLLKKIRESKGDCTLGELGSYICDEVAKQAVVTNRKEQTPTVITSQDLTNSWQNMKLK